MGVPAGLFAGGRVAKFVTFGTPPMKELPVLFTALAEEDLDQIEDYISGDGGRAVGVEPMKLCSSRSEVGRKRLWP